MTDGVVRDLAEALGLHGDGAFDPSWLHDPIARLSAILSDAGQRDAFQRFLDAVIPGPAGDRAGWHPLLWSGDPAGPPPFGNVYLVLDPRGPDVELSVAGEFHNAPSDPFQLRVSATVPLLRTHGADVDAAFGPGGSAIEIAVALTLPGSTADVRLESLTATLTVAFGDPPRVAPHVEIRGFRAGSAPPQDFVLDASALTGGALDLVLGLVQETLSSAPEPLRTHLLPAIGLGGPLPHLAIRDIAHQGDLLRNWLAELVDQRKLAEWFGHVASLLGAAPSPPGAGTLGDPLAARLTTGPVDIALTLAESNGRLYPGIALRAGAASAIQLSADIALLGVPIRGSPELELLPEASVTLRSPSPLLAPVLAADGTTVAVAAGAARAGIALQRGRPQPLVELVDVTLAGHTHPRIDLTNLDEIGALAADAIEALLLAALAPTADSPGRHVLALIGVLAPTHTTTGDIWTGDGGAHRPRLDVLRFVGDPLGAIAAFHRAAITLGGWGALLGELALLLGLDDAITGSGLLGDPWVFPIGSAGAAGVQVVAFHEGDVDLHVGVRVTVTHEPFVGGVIVNVAVVSLPAAGPPSIALLHEHHVELVVTPVPLTDFGRVLLGASRFLLGVRWRIGSAPIVEASVHGAVVEVDEVALPPFDVQFPFDGAPLTLPDDVLRALVRSAALRWGGQRGFAAAGAIGLVRDDLGLAADAPLLADLAAPRAALRSWFRALLTGAAAADGTRHVKRWLRLLSAAATDRLRSVPSAPEVLGAGTAADPWRVAFDASRECEGWLWLEPGPAAPGLADALAHAAESSSAFSKALTLARPHVPALRDVVEELDDARLASGIDELSDFFAQGDGVVPLESQAPEGFTRTGVVTATHVSALSAAATTIRGEIGADVALLLSAPFGDATSYADVIGSTASAAFDFRQPGIPPDRVDLRGVAAVVPFYTVDLAGTETTSVGAQIVRVIDHLETFRPSVPVVLVAHSTTGRAAVVAAAQRAARVVKVITVGTPHLGAAPPYLGDIASGLAAKLARAFVPSMAATRPASDLVASIVDGVAAPGVTAVVPTQALAEETPTPAPAGPPIVVVPIVAGSTLLADLANGLRAALPVAPPDPTAVRFAVSARLDDPAPVGEIEITTELCMDLGRLGLVGASLDSAARRVRIAVRMERADAWILGGPGTQSDGTPWPARIRRARAECVWDGSALTTDVELVDAGLSGPTRTVRLDDPDAASLLDALFASLAGRGTAAPLMQTLGALGVLVPGTTRLAADALAALRADGSAYLASRLRAALEGAILYGADPHAGWHAGPLTIRPDATGLSITVDHDILSAAIRADMSPLELSGLATWRVADLSLTWTPGTLDLSAPPWIETLRLVPAGDEPPRLVERIAFSTAADGVIRALLGIRAPLSPLDAVLSGRIELAPRALSARTLSLWLADLGVALGLPPRADGVFIPPASLLLSIGESGDRRLEIRIATEHPIGDALDVSAALRLGPGLAVEPAATISLHVPDPPDTVSPSAWRDVHVELGVDAHGVSLALAVGAVRVTVLPAFSGWSSLLGGGVALLPHALDEITDRIPDSPVKTAVLGVAGACHLFGPDWSSHAADFEAIGEWPFDATMRSQIVAAIASLLSLVSLPGTLTRSGARIAWSAPPLTAPLAGSVIVTLDWTAPVPQLGVTGAIDVTLSNGGAALDHIAMQLGLDVLVAENFHGTASAALDRPLGVNVRPTLEIGVRRTATGAEPVLRVLPLRTAAADGPLVVTAAPTPGVTSDDAALAGSLGFDVLLPLLTALVERATGSATLWPGGPAIPALVNASGVFDGSHRLVDPPPDVATVLANVITAMSAEATIGALTLTIGGLDAAGRVGIAAAGSVPIPVDTVELDLLLGGREGGEERRIEVVLLSRDAGRVVFSPSLHARHVGVGLRGRQGAPLIVTDAFRLDGVEGFVDVDLDFDLDGVAAEFNGAGVTVDNVGVSLGAARGGGNAIASGLMRSASSGDAAPAQPAFGVTVEYRKSEAGEEGVGAGFELAVRLHGENDRKIVIGIHSAFGPLYIDQVTVELEKTVDPAWIALQVDGGVSLAGFTAQVDDLGVQIPTHHLDDPSRWVVDLAGLGIAYSGGGVSLVGGLLKHPLDPPGTGVEYLGMLQLRSPKLGAVAVGAWSRQTDAAGEFDSLLVFAAAFVTVSFAPYFQLHAFGAGFAYNRALIVPERAADVPSFVLVSVLDDPSAVNRPMDVLERVRMPARRGSFWLAAGMQGAIFTVIDAVAVVYVSIDRNVEIGLLGVARLAQPKAQPIVTIELALKARYSDAEGVLSIQAQLSDNSWLFVSDCQLTGGFAFFIWFRTGKFVVTIGGYHPSFRPPPEFPVVPRLGFRCDVLRVIHLKGEAYFALTNSCVMAGVRIEAAYDVGWLRAWFRAWADFLLAWDPLHYEASIGVELGADFDFEIDLLFGSVTVHFSVSVGATVDLIGPPLHGEVHANLGPLSIAVPFGDARPPRPPLLSWEQFRDRYVLAGDPTAAAVSMLPGDGLVPPSSGATPPQGTARADAWRFAAEFSLHTTTAMAASRVAGPVGAEIAVAGVDIDLAPMGVTTVDATHRLTIARADGGALGAFDPDRWVVDQEIGAFAAATWRYQDPPDADADLVRALAGMELHAVAEALQPSAAVPISTLVDVGDPLPLPFATQGSTWRDATVLVGAAANSFSREFSTADIVALVSSDSPALAGLGVRGGIEGTARRALRARRSPPVVAALSEGMDLAAVGRGVAAPPRPVVAPPSATRLHLLHASLGAVDATSQPVVATTATRAGARLTRTRPPTPTGIVGTITKLATAAPTTRIAAAPAVLPQGPAARRGIATIASQAVDGRVAVPSGAMHVWDVPRGQRSISVRGDAARLVALGRAGVVLLDLEVVGDHVIPLPERTQRLALWSLGKSARSLGDTPGLGAVSLAAAPTSPVSVGWYSGSRLFVVDRLVALCRGARIRFSTPLGTRATDALGMQPASRIVREQSTVETTLPHGIDSVLVLAVATDPTEAARGDLDVRVDDASLGAPLLFRGTRGEGALYPVRATQDFRVTVASVTGYRVTGVVGLHGSPTEIAAWIHADARTDFVADGPLTVDGSVTISFQGVYS